MEITKPISVEIAGKTYCGFQVLYPDHQEIRYRFWTYTDNEPYAFDEVETRDDVARTILLELVVQHEFNGICPA